MLCDCFKTQTDYCKDPSQVHGSIRQILLYNYVQSIREMLW